MSRLLVLAGALLIPVAALIVFLKWKMETMAERYRLPSGPFPSTKGVLLFLLPLPVLLAALVALGRGQLTHLLGDAAGYGLFVAGALLLRRGLRSEGEYDRRRIARIPWPFKTLGSGLIAAATGITAWLGADHHPAIAIAFGTLAWLGCYLHYGADPRAAKRFTDGYGMDATDQVVQALEQAEHSIAAIEEAIRDIRNAELNRRLRSIAGLAREILKLLEEDPRDLRRARKFLNVYLDGAQKVIEGYARTHVRVDAPDLDDHFRRVLVTIEDVFQEQRQKLLETDITDLDVQIEVLTTQLKQEGVI